MRGRSSMSDDPQSTRGHVSPASVAYDLMRDILFEDPVRPAPVTPEFRVYVLDLYAECLLAVRGRRAAFPEAKRAGRPRPLANGWRAAETSEPALPNATLPAAPALV